ncbi:TVP38/TMEM64 family protein [Candidatus Magnetominusculus dajiuhuensis]|uniref:TVP38/TMEM64 family protein n=1 Tax=Candidatus Magnetominusculus dajiuhuensis TaxID=3137712 RepID=UPI003B434B64
MKKTGNIGTVLKAAVIAALVVFCIMYYDRLNPAGISAFAAEYGGTAPVVFIAVCALRPLLFFIPTMGLSIVAGLLFGAFNGALYVAFAGVLSSMTGYWFARWIGRDAIVRLTGVSEALRRLDRWAAENARRAVLSMRLFQLPWDIVSYWAGISGVGFRDFFIASMIPLLPVSFLYTYMGSKILTPLHGGFIAAVMAIAGLGALPHVIKKLKNSNRTKS